MNYTTATDVGRRKREQDGINEDSVAISLLDETHRDTDRESGVFVLADGAGGAAAGDVASYVATVEVSRRLTDRLWRERGFGEVVDAADADRSALTGDAVGDPLATLDDEAVQSCIEGAVRAAHTRLLEVIDEFDLGTAYTTVVVAVTVGDRLHYGWVGDSRAYVVNVGDDCPDDQRTNCLTKDHSEVERLVTEGTIDAVEAHVHRHGNRITRALGGTSDEDPRTSSVAVDTATVPLFGDDVVLLTSDGLIDAYTGAPQLHQAYEDADDTDSVAEHILEKSVTDDEIRDVILEEPSLAAAADRFVTLSNERGGKDNVSLALFRDPDLPDARGTLPLRAYDPDPERIANWDTVKRVDPTDDAPDSTSGDDPDGQS